MAVLAATLPLALLSLGGASAGASNSGNVTLLITGTFASSQFGIPESNSGAQAAAAEINHAGGINGKKLVIESCNDELDPATAESCVRQAVSQKLPAVLTGIEVYPTLVAPILTQAKEPWIDPSPDSQVEVNSSDIFALTAGPLGANMAGSYAEYKLGCRKLGVIWAGGSAESDLNEQGGIDAFKAAGGNVVYTGETSLGEPSYTSYVTSAFDSGAQCLAAYLTPADALKVLTAVEASSHPNAMISASGQVASLGNLSTLGAGAADLVGSTFVQPFNSSGMKPFVAAMKKYEPSASIDEYAYEDYAAVQVFAGAIKNLSTVNSTTVASAMHKLTAVGVPGLIGTVNFVSPQHVSGASRLYNTDFELIRATANGKTVNLGKVNVTPAFKILFGSSGTSSGNS